MAATTLIKFRKFMEKMSLNIILYKVIVRKITLSAQGAQRRNVEFVEIGLTGQTDFIAVLRY
jgi:hypothetical protein